MLLTIAIMILAYMIMGKEISALTARVKNINWRRHLNKVWAYMRPWAVKVGRTTARPVLQCYYVLQDENTSTTDRLAIYAAVAYTVLPMDFIPRAAYKFFGVLDDGLAVMYIYRKIKDKITPEIKTKVEDTLNEWFGVEYELVD